MALGLMPGGQRFQIASHLVANQRLKISVFPIGGVKDLGAKMAFDRLKTYPTFGRPRRRTLAARLDSKREHDADLWPPLVTVQ